ncbi:SAM-dependent methyltransferase [Paraburkholderia youngii]|uniref:SAM-dependent methyltransferase n=1 Tax=Paraburkholderia youngii TaxID=2782701 RepID=UPI003D251F1C
MKSNDHILTRDEVLSIFATACPGLRVNFDGFWFRLPQSVESRIEERAGVGSGELGVKAMTYWVRLDEESAPLKRVLGTYNLYPVRPEHYYLEMLDDGRLIRKYQQILGSPLICGTVDEEALEVLIERVATLLGPMVRAEAAKKGLTIACRRTVAEELALLTATSTQINLPKEHLVHYPRIKVLIENAGGAYNSRGFFAFEHGNDPHGVLARLRSGEKINIQQQTQSFYTPASLANDVCRQVLPSLDVDLESKPLKGMRGLDPSAGEGALADVVRQWGAEMVTVENWAVAVGKLRAKGYDVHDRDFLTVRPEEIGLFDFVVANPPFTRDADIRHTRHMLRFLKPGGVLSVVMSPRWQESDQRSHVAFRELLKGYDVATVNVPAGTFRASGTDIATVRLVIRDPRVAKVPRGAQLELLAA